ncbi:hypothetical protein VTK56DRAFT_3716 [Thermocarpiscus australiensis]
MDQGPPDSKRPRLSTGPAWSAGGSHHGVSLLHPTPSPAAAPLPHHPTPSAHYHQSSPVAYARPAGPGDPLPPPHPHPHSHHQPHQLQHPYPHQHQNQHPHPHPHPAPPPPPPPPVQTPIDDRRQHEGDRFPPMQEHRQPPHSPAPPPFPAYGPREPMVKPDPADDTLPQLRRPLSTGNVQDNMTPMTPHSTVTPHSQSYPAEEKRHMNYDNGPQLPMYRQPSYPAQSPLPHPQSYEYPPPYGPPHGDLPYPIQVAAATGKRKAQRASQACDMCRQLKAKCDELKPCKSCKEKKVECKYRESVPKQQDKIAADILETLMALRNDFGSNFGALNQRLSKLERAMKHIAPSLELGPEPVPEEEGRPESADSAVPMAEDACSSSPGDTAAGAQAAMGTLEARTITRIMEEEKEVEPGPHVRPGQPSIPPNHTTLAAFLLKWRPIEALVRRYLEAENVRYVDEFPIRQEERRGLLRIWGRGEGLDSSRADREAARDLGSMEVQDDYSDTSAPSPADCWGAISGSPGPVDGGPMIGGRTPDFSEAHVWKYVQSFQDNIQNMHPLILPVELKAMVKLFLNSVQQNMRSQPKSSGIAKFVGSPAPQSETGSKRKRSPAPDGAEQSLPKPAKLTFQRSINNALVLLVLALGKICLWKDKIPDVVPVSEQSQSSPMARNGYPVSPVQGSPSSLSRSTGLPSPKDGGERSGSSRRASFHGAGPPGKTGTSLKRNMDVIPGLDYFAYATDILGGQLAGTSLRHVHAYILAGLYHGQLGRVLESYAYIQQAGYALQVKMRPSLDRLRKLQENMHIDQNAVTEKSDNQLVFAFWTCLQLESDIIAELPLPQSHILAYEDMMPYPNINLAREHGFEEPVLQSYLAQLYLRKRLNKIHGMLYNPEKPLQAFYGARCGVIEYIQNSLDMRFVPPQFKFSLDDPPAKDILSARLRAKFWGAQVITYRPFVRQILEFNYSRANDTQMPVSGDFRSGITVPVISPDAKSKHDIPREVVEYAAKGVKALIESTRAFHGLKEKRYIVTNVFGTAHAQWGNLLTLAAVFRDPTLSVFVDEQTLRELFSRTIAFFRIIAAPTSALNVDMRILEGLERELWGKPDSADLADHLTESSLSSHSNTAPPIPPVTPISSVPPPMPPVSGQPGVTMDGVVSTLPPALPSPLPATSPGTVPGGVLGGPIPGTVPGLVPGVMPVSDAVPVPLSGPLPPMSQKPSLG